MEETFVIPPTGLPAAGRTVSFCTLGCKLNFAETSTAARRFAERGYTVVRFGQPSDVCVVNTCAVTEVAEKKGRNAIRRARRSSPGAVVVVMGCFAQASPAQVAALPEVDIIAGNQGKAAVVDLVESGFRGVAAGPLSSLCAFDAAHSRDERTRSFLKIQDGCDRRCAYCAIPDARGGSRSDTIAGVVDRARRVVAGGVREIVLTGVNIGDFGRGRGERFHHLLEALHEVEGLRRLRISSIEPDLLEDRTIELAAASPVVMPHIHIPLQCGVDRLLRSMRRRYTTGLFAGRVEAVRRLMPDAYVAIDIIAGVPGETDADAAATLDFLAGLGLSELHVFTYSERPGTPAAGMPQVPRATRRDRSHALHLFGAQANLEFCQPFEGQTREVLVESRKAGGRVEGFTDNYLRVSAPGPAGIENRLALCRLGKYDAERQTFDAEIVKIEEN